MNQKIYYTYIVTNKMNTVLYTGVTNNVEYRAFNHKQGEGSIFTKRYNCKKLVYYEEYKYIEDAISREKEIKGWSRLKKEILINKLNPLWDDLDKDRAQ